MNRILFYTVFCDGDDRQTLEMIGHGDMCQFSLTRKLDGDSESENAFSGRTINVKEATRRYFFFAKQFAEGQYSWEDRKYLISTAFHDLID